MTARYVCAALWAIATGLAVTSRLIARGPLAVLEWLFAALLTVLTVLAADPSHDERLVRPTGYRLATGTLLAVALVGIVLGLVPGATETSQLLALYFGLVALVAYRALVARRLGPAILAVAVGLFGYLPAGFISWFGGKLGRHVVPLGEQASTGLAQITLLLLGVVAAAALVSFVQRRDELPDARVLKSGS